MCQPDADGCQPTQVEVRVCDPEREVRCKVRDGLYNLAQELDLYDDYVRGLRDEEVPE